MLSWQNFYWAECWNITDVALDRQLWTGELLWEEGVEKAFITILTSLKWNVLRAEEGTWMLLSENGMIPWGLSPLALSGRREVTYFFSRSLTYPKISWPFITIIHKCLPVAVSQADAFQVGNEQGLKSPEHMGTPLYLSPMKVGFRPCCTSLPSATWCSSAGLNLVL